MTIAKQIVTTYGNDILALANALGLKGAWAERKAKGILNTAWNWHTYGPKGEFPNKAMEDFTRKQAIRSIPLHHPLTIALAKEIRDTPGEPS